MLKKELEDSKQELAAARQTNESLKASVKKQESILAEHAYKAIKEQNHELKEENKEEGEDIGDQVSKLGERLSDIVRRYTVMPK